MATRNNWAEGGDVITVRVNPGREIRIADADGWTHRAPSEWNGGRAVVCPAQEDGGGIGIGEVLYESHECGDFGADSVRLLCAVLEYLRRNEAVAPTLARTRTDDAMALAHLALSDAGWRPEAGQDPPSWHEELRAGHAAYLGPKAVAVGSDQLDTIRGAALKGTFDPTFYGDPKEALEAVLHGAQSSWRSTPYGVVWVDDSA
ncbi:MULTISPECIES: hypothetical protein [unclassified Streptomyces]|uniref:hypothetical protein n=1 Tax=unclassified Streptomyces TaxID=2593676 RepID=UPI0033A53CC7